MFRKNFRKFIAVLLTASFVFSAAVSVYGANFDDEPLQGRQIAPLVAGESRIEEIDGSIFFTIVTDEYMYTSQLTPLGYYNFSVRFTDSNQILTATVSVDDLSAVAVRSSLSDLSALSAAQLAEALYLVTMDDLSVFDLDVFEMTVECAAPEIFYFNDYHENGDLFDVIPQSWPPADAPSGNWYPSMAALISTEFPLYYGLWVATSFDWGTLWGLPNVYASTRVLESRTAFAVFNRNILIPIAVTITVAAMKVGGIPYASLLLMGAFGISVHGVFVSIRDFFIGEHFVSENWDRAVWINSHNRRFASATRTRVWVVNSGTGNTGAGFQVNLVRFPSDSSQWPFHDTRQLMSIGQEQFFREVGMGLIRP